MANSYKTYVGDGVTQSFSVTFPYLSKLHVTVKVAGISVPFTWDSATVVRATTVPANAAQVEIRRRTPATPITNFATANPLMDSDLNGAVLQSLYVGLEAEDDVVQAALGLVPNLDAATLVGHPPTDFPIYDTFLGILADRINNKTANNGIQVEKVLIKDGAVNVFTTAGGPTAYTVATGMSLTALKDGMLLFLKANADCTGASTLAVDGLAAKPWVNPDGTPFVGIEIKNGSRYAVMYDLTRAVFVCLNPSFFVLTGPRLTSPYINGHLVRGALPFSAVQDFFNGQAQVASASVTNAAGGYINFYIATQHGLRHGEVVQLTTTGTLPTGLALATSYVVNAVDAYNFALATLASSTYTPNGSGGAQWTPGASIAWGGSGGTGNHTATPGFVPQTGQIVADIDLVGAGGGGGGSSLNTVTAGNGAIGTDSSISVLGWTAQGGSYGIGATATTEAAGGLGGSLGGIGGGRSYVGQRGQDGTRGAAMGCNGGSGGQTRLSPYGDGGRGATAFDSGAANSYSGGGGGAAQHGSGRPAVTPGTFYGVVIGQGGSGGAAGNAGTAGDPGKNGYCQVRL